MDQELIACLDVRRELRTPTLIEILESCDLEVAMRVVPASQEGTGG